MVRAKRGKRKQVGDTVPVLYTPEEPDTFIDQDINFSATIYSKGEKFLKKTFSMRVIVIDAKSGKRRKDGKCSIDIGLLI